MRMRTSLISRMRRRIIRMISGSGRRSRNSTKKFMRIRVTACMKKQTGMKTRGRKSLTKMRMGWSGRTVKRMRMKNEITKKDGKEEIKEEKEVHGGG